MKEFVIAAFPWICIGIAVALFAADYHMKKMAQKDEKEYENYMIEGMCIGVCAGIILGDNCLSFGMLAGMALGMCIKKEK